MVASMKACAYVSIPVNICLIKGGLVVVMKCTDRFICGYDCGARCCASEEQRKGVRMSETEG